MVEIENKLSSDVEDVNKNLKKATEIIIDVVNKNNWRYNTDIEKYFSTAKTYVISGSLNFRKKIRNRVNRVISKPNIRNINTLCNAFSIQDNLKIKISEKEKSIQNARRNWKKARDVADNFLIVYKKEKGNFYKNK